MKCEIHTDVPKWGCEDCFDDLEDENKELMEIIKEFIDTGYTTDKGYGTECKYCGMGDNPYKAGGQHYPDCIYAKALKQTEEKT